MMDNQAFISEFVEEATGHIDAVEEALLELERGQPGEELINLIFRAVHSIKGTASFFGLHRIVELSHVMESLFSSLRSHELEYRDIMTDVLLEANDLMRTMVDDVMHSNGYDTSKCMLKLKLLAEADDPRSVERQSAARAGGPVIFDERGREWPLDEAERAFIEDSIKHGHYIYRITLNDGQRSPESSINPLQFMKKISSIGNVIQSRSEEGAKAVLKTLAEEGAEYVFLVTSVLEKKLLLLALDINEEQVAVLRPQSGGLRPVEKLNISKSVPGEEDYALRDAMSNYYLPAGPAPADLPVEIPIQDYQWPDDEPPDSEAFPTRFPAFQANEDSIRVSLKTLNELLGLAGEMVLARNQLMRMTEKRGSCDNGLEGIAFRINHLTTELQSKVLQTRMQPASNVFGKFPRLIRDLCQKTGKDIELITRGGQVEMDRSIIEALADPLAHIIRNAVDHGIELPAIREVRGKSRTGRIELEAYHEGGQVHVVVRDDGAGMDADKLRSAAISRSLINNQEALQISEAEALNLIFRPGFSTAPVLSDLSGRGVGMDVVKTNIEKTGGTIDIRTEVGKGTAFDLTLPLTVAIVPALIVEAEGLRYAIPRANVQEVLRINGHENTGQLELVFETPVLRMRGSLLPLVKLAGVINEQVERTAGWSGIAAMTAREIGQQLAPLGIVARILVIKAGARRFGLVVERISDGEEILVNPLPHYLSNCSIYSGVTIMGDGRPAMILDPVGLAERTNLRLYEESLSSLMEQSAERTEAMFEKQKIMLFKCSGHETFGIDLSMVARVEEIAASDLEVIGERTFIRYRDSIVRVIRPEELLPVSRGETRGERLFIMIPKLVPRPMAILFHKIYDTVETAVHFNEETVQAPGILGSAVLNERIVLLLNLYDVFEQVEMMSGEAGGSDEREENAPFLQDCRILLLEDTPFFARIEKDYLEAAGARVSLAGNGQEGMNLLASESFDVIVSDINMPVMDGIQFIRQVRSDSRFADIPALALTSLAGDKHLQAGLGAGFDDYEIKLDKSNLLSKLHRLIQGRNKLNAG